MVAVLNPQGQRRAGGEPFHDPTQDLGVVLLDLHARAGPVPGLPAGQVAG